MSVMIKSGNSGELAEVKSGSLVTALTQDPENAGIVAFMSQNDDGSVTGTQYLKSPETSGDFRLRVGVDTLYFIDTFNYAAQNTSNWIYRTSTLTTTWAGGYMTLNGGAATGTGSTSVQTYKYIPMYGASSLYVEMSIALTNTPPANWQADFGLMTMGTSAPFTPSDGVYFRITSAGIYGVMNYNTSESTTNLLISASAISLNSNKKFTIVVSEDECEFWMDDVLLGEKKVPAGVGQPFMAASQPFGMRLVHTNTAGAICQLKISDVIISQADLNVTKPWSYQMAGTGHMSYQAQNGATMGSTANMINSYNPTSGSIANATVSASFVGLGGQFAVLPTLTANTDGILCSYLNPAPTVNLTGRTLVVNGIRISGVVTTLLATSGSAPVIYLFSAAFGHTGISLATAEGATAKSARRVPLGIQTYAGNAVAGTLGQSVEINFETPIVVNPNEYFQIVAKNAGTVTTSGVITFLVTIIGYYQ